MAQRMSREQSRAQTRARLLEAATEVFVDKGFHGASVEEIADRAGYTRGAFYSNFDDKADIFLALMEERSAEQIDEIGGILRSAGSLDEALTALAARDGRRPHDPTWLMLGWEFWLYAMRHPKVRPRLAARQRAIRREYARAIRGLYDALGVEPPTSVDDMAVVLHVLDEGIVTQHHIDPRHVRQGLFFDVLALLHEALLALAEKRA